MAFVLTVQIKRKKKMYNQKKFFRYFQVAALITVLSLFATLTFEAVHAGHEEVCHEENRPVSALLLAPANKSL